MKSNHSIISAGMLIAILVPALSSATGIIQHTGMCDASAAVPAGAAMFVVANDEDNVLRVYKRDESGVPLANIPLNAFLKIDDQDKHPEADLEGATRIGNRIYWIASHGANKGGKPRPNRRRLFATELRVDSDNIVELNPVGTPYLNLLEDLAKVKELEKFDLATAATKAPEQDGLNIEGLSRTPEGALLIAFRNPIPDNKALLVPLENPDEAVDGKAARLGKPIFLWVVSVFVASNIRKLKGNTCWSPVLMTIKVNSGCIGGRGFPRNRRSPLQGSTSKICVQKPCWFTPKRKSGSKFSAMTVPNRSRERTAMTRR